jgi:hypothetical protein
MTFGALPATAQQTPPDIVPKVVRPEIITRPTPSSRPLDSPLTAVGPDGILYVDWELAERLADNPTLPRAEMARVMLALRDGHWRHMPK